MSPRVGAWLGNLALLAGSVLLCGALGEVVVRALARGARGGKEQAERNRYTEHDPVLGWRKRPHAEVSYERREYVVRYRVNARGLRGPDRPYEKPPGARRVLALGDSFVEAFMVRDAETVTSRLEAALAGRGCPAEVLNGGTVGYSTDQEYLFYREEGRRYAPDVVVAFVYHNDIPYLTLDRYQSYPKPVLDFGARPPAVRNHPVAAYVPPPAAPSAPPGPRPASYLWEWAKERVERTSARTYNRLAAAGLWEPLRKLPMNEELRLYKVPELGHLRPSWSAFTWTLETLDAAARADGARLAVAYVPSRMEVSDRVWELTRERYEVDASYERGAVAARVAYIAGRLGIPHLDLTPPLAAADGLMTPTYFQTDSHWNARGQEAAGRAVGEFLARAGALPGCR